MRAQSLDSQPIIPAILYSQLAHEAPAREESAQKQQNPASEDFYTSMSHPFLDADNIHLKGNDYY
ncbi:MAG: hypothetical protein GKR89_16760 [Candidatus Latescibacteria bacterium]|nr:hypothetical protein [Candidatus Latescibacterota bacterium]